MLFYRIQGVMENFKSEEENPKRMREVRHEICLKSERFNMQSDKNTYFFVIDIADSLVEIGAIIDRAEKLERLSREYVYCMGFALNDVIWGETTFDNIRSLLRDSDRIGYVDDSEDVLERFDLDKIDSRHCVEFGENIVDFCKKDELFLTAQKHLMNDTLLPELERIYTGKAQKRVGGHPVHYMLETDDRDTRKEVYRLLLNALYANGRLESGRYTYLDVNAGDRFSLMAYDALYKACKGGTIVVRYNANDSVIDEDIASGEEETIANLCRTAKRYRNSVLTFFCLTSACKKTKGIFFENLGTVSIVEIKEDFVKSDRAAQYLRMLAKKEHIRTDKKLFAMLDADKTYLATELKVIFDEWYNSKLKSSVYPQYKDIATVSHEVLKESPRGTAYDELNEMIGLSEAKAVIKKAINYYKMQKLYQERGIKEDYPAMHMIFSGNPGTAKTTVARLFACIMRENGLLSKGQIVEVGRGDLISKYVGWTAQNVQAKFKAAKGGVLFIDEAYSLVDDRDGSFGDEAINTIVQEMENHREDVVVIFAGYPDKMEGFLQKNPGLRSRIAFHIPFADYSTDELCEIAKLMCRSKGLSIDGGAMDKLKDLFDGARKHADFGNGRYVRNIFEQAKMNQASRLMELDFESISDNDIFTITADDIILTCGSAAPKQTIGFCG